MYTHIQKKNTSAQLRMKRSYSQMSQHNAVKTELPNTNKPIPPVRKPSTTIEPRPLPPPSAPKKNTKFLPFVEIKQEKQSQASNPPPLHIAADERPFKKPKRSTISTTTVNQPKAVISNASSTQQAFRSIKTEIHPDIENEFAAAQRKSPSIRTTNASALTAPKDQSAILYSNAIIQGLLHVVEKQLALNNKKFERMSITTPGKTVVVQSNRSCFRDSESERMSRDFLYRFFFNKHYRNYLLQHIDDNAELHSYPDPYINVDENERKFEVDILRMYRDEMLRQKITPFHEHDHFLTFFYFLSYALQHTEARYVLAKIIPEKNWEFMQQLLQENHKLFLCSNARPLYVYNDLVDHIRHMLVSYSILFKLSNVLNI